MGFDTPKRAAVLAPLFLSMVATHPRQVVTGSISAFSYSHILTLHLSTFSMTRAVMMDSLMRPMVATLA